MKVLLDTHTLIWWWAKGGERLSPKVRDLLTNSETDASISAVNAWEMVIKHRLGKLPEAEEGIAHFAVWAERDTMAILPIGHEHALMAGGFDAPHADPFDRLLAAQSIIENMPIVSIDDKLDAFGCERIWT